MPEKDPPGAECQEEGDDEGSNPAGLIFFGLLIASVAMGEAISAAYGWMAFGLGLFLVGLIECWKE